MESYEISGGKPLEGTIEIHGAKNSVLPILAACVVCSQPCIIRNCPDIADVHNAILILRHLGCVVQHNGDVVEVDASVLTGWEIPCDLMSNMRSSVLFVGALMARQQQAIMSAPGGCALGSRPVDLHKMALQAMGCVWEDSDEIISCSANKLSQCNIVFPIISVGATENAILAALGCDGAVNLKNVAREPEIVDLVRFLRSMGAEIYGEGTSAITVIGSKPLHATQYRVMADRIETATYLSAGAACGGTLFLQGAQAETILPVIQVFRSAGCAIYNTGNGLHIQSSARLRSPGNLITEVYPGFPTDAQAPVMAALCCAEGVTGITETIFNNRLKHVDYLNKMGADIRIHNNETLLYGVKQLYGADVSATDLRCGAALIVAGLSATGITRVFGVNHIARGYENIAKNLQGVGAQIQLLTKEK